MTVVPAKPWTICSWRLACQSSVQGSGEGIKDEFCASSRLFKIHTSYLGKEEVGFF